MNFWIGFLVGFLINALISVAELLFFYKFRKGEDMNGGVSLINGHIDENKCCENCVYYDNDKYDQPCCSCVEYSDWIRNAIEME